MPTQTQPAPQVPSATIRDILDFLEAHNYKFSDQEKLTRVIDVPKKRGVGTHKRSIRKPIYEDLKLICKTRPDFDQIEAAFTGFKWRAEGAGGGAGRTAESKEEYISKLGDTGLVSNSAGFLSINAAKLFGIESKIVSRLNDSGDPTESIAFDHHKFSVSVEGKTIKITHKGKVSI